MDNSFEQKILKNLEKLPEGQVKELLLSECTGKRSLEIILESISYVVLAIDNSGLLTYINTAGERLLGNRRKKLIGHSIYKLKYDEPLRETINQALADKDKILNQEITLTNAKIASLSSFPLLSEGHVAGNVFVIDDITESFTKKIRKYHEESIESLGILTAGVAHEIKNPLGALDLHIQLINRALQREDFKGRQEIREYVGILDDEIKRLDKIVNDFLFSVRPIKPQLKIEDLNSIIRETLEVVYPELEQQQIQLDVKLAEKLPRFPIDKNYLKQAILNIIQNATSAIMEQKRKDGLIRITTAYKNDKILLDINDNGAGISQDNINKIFEPFFSTKEMGTGLGLTIVYKIIHEHKGEIIISSDAGQGTKFRIEFDIKKRAPKLLAHKRR